MVLKNNSLAHNLWKTPPVKPLMKVHIFNYTNAEEIMSGAETKFKLQELGPYTYRETIEHVNEVFNPNGTLTFQFKRSYQFLANESVGTQFDRIFVPNLPLLSAMSMAKESYYIAQMGLSAVIQSVGATAFRPLPAHRFLWGYDDELVALAKPWLHLSGDMVYEKFGILVTKNGTEPDRFTINTGETDINMLGVIDRLNGKDKMDHWGTEECNRVDATDGSLYPVSMLDRKQTLYVFNKDLCRRFPLTYVKDLEVFNGIPALRYSPPNTVFDNPSTYQPNQCYCHMDSGVCPPQGVFNSSPCAFGGAPAFASFPHFYLGDPALLKNIEGLKPDPEKHNSYIDIHPTLGMPLGASSKMQINIQIRKSSGIRGFDFLPDDMYLPVAWMEVTVSELPQEIRTLVYHATFSAHQAQLVIWWGCIVTMIVCGILLLVAIRARISADTLKC
ncbi:scavenger receptor class B member 1-like isoform X2 [Arctopsyche grandis]